MNNQQHLRSPSIPVRTTSHNANTRAPSSLKRSSDLLSMEQELRELLKNSNLTHKQKSAFEDMLKSIFDLFQTPVSNTTGNHDVNGEPASLIDASSVALYSKMQLLVSALTSLIMNEEEASRIEGNDSREASFDNGIDSSFEKNSSTEFSEEEDYNGYYNSQINTQRNVTNSYGSQFNSPPVTIRSRGSYSPITRQDIEVIKPRSPAHSSPSRASFHNAFDSLGQRTYHESEYPRPQFQVMPTSVPRSFSNQTTNISRSSSRPSSRPRPTSMYISPTLNTSIQSNQRRSHLSPSYSRRSSLLYEHEQPMGNNNNNNNNQDYGIYGSHMESNTSVSSSGKKRYSMRF